MLDGHRRRASHGVPVTAGGCILTGMSWLSNRTDDAGTADQAAGAVCSSVQASGVRVWRRCSSRSGPVAGGLVAAVRAIAS
jgi:hypothetical protein